jgi:hypothetical protein
MRNFGFSTSGLYITIPNLQDSLLFRGIMDLFKQVALIIVRYQWLLYKRPACWETYITIVLGVGLDLKIDFERFASSFQRTTNAISQLSEISWEQL